MNDTLRTTAIPDHRLRHLRKRAGLSLAEAAREFGIHPVSLSEIEYGERGVPWDMRRAWIRCYEAGIADRDTEARTA